MASKKPAPDDLLAELDNLQSQATSRPSKTSATRTSRQGQPTQSSQSEQDILADLGNLAQRPSSRPGTPSLRGNVPVAAGNRSPKRTSTATPPPGRTSEEKSNNGQRKSGDSARSYHQSFTPATTTTEASTETDSQSTPAPAATKNTSSWWGGLLSSASAAVSQAQAAVKEIQQNEEAQKWADQVRGNVGSLRGLGGDLRSLAIPTFQNILQTIAPPISSHERLQIHITHDLQNYPTLDPLIYQVFSRVMSQVEGGDLMVIQRGQEASPRRDSKEHPQRAANLGSWHDGPWWRSDENRSVNAVKGIVEGTKLVRTSAENYATEYFASRGGLDEVVKRATQTPSESNPTRNSEIFLAIQAISQDVRSDLFSGSTASSSSETESQVKEVVNEKIKEEILFAIYLHDPIHGIAFHSTSQVLPSQWIEWLDAPNAIEGALPESIEDIIASGGIDPREWVSEWVEETLNLAVGAVAQRYVARRMGVGEGGIRKGKLRADKATEVVMESGGGEAARALGGM